MSPVAFDLLIGRYGAENDLCKFAGVKRTVGDSSKHALARVGDFRDYDCLPDHFQRVLNDGHGQMSTIIY